jgi:hypothetical protein
MEASVDGSVYGDTQRHRMYHEAEERVYREAELEVDTRNRHRDLLAS